MSHLINSHNIVRIDIFFVIERLVKCVLFIKIERRIELIMNSLYFKKSSGKPNEIKFKFIPLEI